MSEQDQPDQYKRITQAQFEIWMDNPVTVAYMQCLNWSAEQISEIMGNGGFVDASNPDLTLSKLHAVIGQKVGLYLAAKPERIMSGHEMLEKPEDKE